MLCCSRPYRFHRTQRKKPKRTDLDLPEVNRPSRVHRITKRPCLHRTAIARFRRRLRSRRIPLLRLNLWRLCQARVQAPILRALPEHRLPPKNPPYRRLESLTRDNPLPRDLGLPWVSRRAGKAVLSPGRSQHCGADVQESHARAARRSLGDRYGDQTIPTGWHVSDYKRRQGGRHLEWGVTYHKPLAGPKEVTGTTSFFVTSDPTTDERQALPLATEDLATRLVTELSEGW